MAEDQANKAGGAGNPGNSGETRDAGTDGSSLRRANVQQERVNRLERLRSCGDSSLMGAVVHKVCNVCGADLTHKMRFKDGTGKYWCAHCNDADHERTRPAPCSDCGIEMPRNQMTELRGMVLCPVCHDNHQKAGAPLQMRHAATPQKDAASESSIPLLPLLFAAAAVIVAIIVIAMVFR